MPSLVLASSSPFRRQILDKLNLDYECHSPDIDESPLNNEQAIDLVERLAIAKAQAVAEAYPNATDYWIGPSCRYRWKNRRQTPHARKAVQQLKSASGNAVTFYTGLALHNSATGDTQSEVVPFSVHFRELSDGMIENYLHAEKPYNCAGSFKSEGMGIALFEKLEGDDPNTLIGMPLIRLIRMLENENFPVL